jgi:mono/diheme cytochrome c family protein
MKRIHRFACYAVLAFAVVGCHPDMWRQPKAKPQQKSEFFGDGSVSRLPIEGTVPYGKLRGDDALERGYVNARLVEQMPVPVTAELIARGQERFNVFCRHCHGAIGDGEGMIAQRGYKVERPVASYHTDRLRQMPVGHFFDVITNGYGAMFPFSDRIPVEDRWAIVAYIRVLQRSQNAQLSDVPAERRGELDRTLDEIVAQMKEGAHAEESQRSTEEGH